MKNQSKEILYPKFPINLPAIQRFQFSSDRISYDSLLFFQEYREFRLAAHKINTGRSKNAQTEQDQKSLPYAKPSDLNATALINLVYFHLFKIFQTSVVPDFSQQLNNLLQTQFSTSEKTELIQNIQKLFPYEADLSQPDKLSNFLIRSIIIQLNNENPALIEYQDLFSNKELVKMKKFQLLLTSVDSLFSQLPSIGDSSSSLLDFLRAPFKKFPNSLYDQLAFIQENWAQYIQELLPSFVSALDFLKEEYKPVFTGFGGECQTTDFGLLNDEYEAFTDDKNWMPNVVMLAKSALVWLDQLSKKYRYKIEKLNQVPDKELDSIQKQGFSSIWLIGIWERSQASKRIKHIYGNKDAEASAYSLYDYEISEALGGWEALENLRKRCKTRGIRLASDMVPNHTALDSKWMLNHPDRFLQLPYSPMPHYSFTGENLTGRDDIGVYLEDQYYSMTDCAVVFKRVDFNTGEERYIYHGNDGTGLPWNDTAQIDYLNPEAREAIIQMILHVARNFSIIRFDAAMTLAKKHIQRLWYPAPGQGGDIPTRSEFALSTADFNKALPKEFWREVVDRIAIEAPDTLLLAEAFWMLEGYFVRTLGMHRVYNSAFMHMLRDEKNTEYRYLIKETLAFDPQILKRYVNFMNNPDEDTAAEQFGKDDKYFGVCLLLCTLPGLPMFGHGQIEGYYEKYGMEFKRALWDETPDEYLRKRHEKEIFPLIHQRYLYSEVHNFRLYDFRTFNNNLNENVFAYSNYTEKENSLVIFNNKYERTSGKIFYAVPFKDKTTAQIWNNTITDFISAVTHNPNDDDYIIFTEVKTELDYIRRFKDIKDVGLTCMLSGYEYQVFQNFIKVTDTDGSYSFVHDHLNGSGVYDIAFEARTLKFKPFYKAMYNILSPNLLSLAFDSLEETISLDIPAFLHEQSLAYLKCYDEQKEVNQALPIIEKQLLYTLNLLFISKEEKNHCSSNLSSFLARESEMNEGILPLLLNWSTILAIKSINPALFYQLALEDLVKYNSKRYFKKHQRINKLNEFTKLIQIIDKNEDDLLKILQDPQVIEKLHINKYNSILWFDLPQTEELLSLRLINQVLKMGFSNLSKRKLDTTLNAFYQEYLHLQDLLVKSEYQLSSFIEKIKK